MTARSRVVVRGCDVSCFEDARRAWAASLRLPRRAAFATIAPIACLVAACGETVSLGTELPPRPALEAGAAACVGKPCGAPCGTPAPCTQPPCPPPSEGRCDARGACSPDPTPPFCDAAACVGKPCGAPCDPCPPDDLACTADLPTHVCGPGGACVFGAVLCPPCQEPGCPPPPDPRCAGKACGEPCEPCEPGAPGCGPPPTGTCDAKGACREPFEVECPPPPCDGVPDGAPCQLCAPKQLGCFEAPAEKACLLGTCVPVE